ncbi:hypothetical protein LLG96_03460 [bacterium]|nr:hypothetical protein [bacterium]
MLISEHHKRIAVCIEEGATFNEKATVLKWKSILDNPNTTLRIIVRDEDESEAIMQLAQRNNIDIECFRVKRSTQRKRKIPPKAGKKGGFRVDWVVIMTSVMIIFVSLLLFGPALMKLFKIQDESRPFETGKQIDQFQKTIDDLKKK